LDCRLLPCVPKPTQRDWYAQCGSSQGSECRTGTLCQAGTCRPGLEV